VAGGFRGCPDAASAFVGADESQRLPYLVTGGNLRGRLCRWLQRNLTSGESAIIRHPRTMLILDFFRAVARSCLRFVFPHARTKNKKAFGPRISQRAQDAGNAGLCACLCRTTDRPDDHPRHSYAPDPAPHPPPRLVLIYVAAGLRASVERSFTLASALYLVLRKISGSAGGCDQTWPNDA
jgi:hypothetical protein